MNPSTTPAELDTTPDLTAVAALTGPLEQAGWTLDAVTEMSGGSVDYLYVHPSGRQIAAVTAPAGEPVELTLTGLTLDQAVGAVTGAGYAPAVEVEPTAAPTPDLLAAVRQVIDAGRLEWGTGVDVDRVQGEAHTALVRAYQAATGTTADAELDHRDRLADELVRIADDIRTRHLPVGEYVTLGLGVLDSRTDLERVAAYLGSQIREDGGTGSDIPFTEHGIPLGDTQYGPDLTIRAQIQPDGRSEVERLRAEVAELRAAQGGTR